MNRRKFLKWGGIGLATGTIMATQATGEIMVGAGKLLNHILEKTEKQDLQIETQQELNLEKKFGIKITGNTAPEQITRLTEAFVECEKYWDTFKEQMKNVKQIDLQSEVMSSWADVFNFGGMAVPYLNIIYLDGFFLDTILMHELAHIHHYNLDHPFDFMSEWKEIAQIEYGTLSQRGKMGGSSWKNVENKTYGYLLADHGCMSPYGAGYIWDDIADFQGRLFYAMSTFKENKGDALKECQNQIRKNAFAKDPREDPRYIRKLELLLREEFISQREFELVKPLFVY